MKRTSNINGIACLCLLMGRTDEAKENIQKAYELNETHVGVQELVKRYL